MYVRACVYKKKVVTLCAFRERVCLFSPEKQTEGCGVRANMREK